MNKETQCQRVLQYIDEFGSITQLDALRELGVMRLSACIFELRRRGYEIVTTFIIVKNRFGEPARIASYSRRAA